MEGQEMRLSSEPLPALFSPHLSSPPHRSPPVHDGDGQEAVFKKKEKVFPLRAPCYYSPPGSKW